MSRLARAGVAPGSIARLVLQRAMRIPAGGIRLRNGISITAPGREPLMDIFKEIWLDLRYAENTLDASKAGVVVDIGAHVGVFALWVAARNPHAKVVCVEPSPRLGPFLQRNISTNGFTNIAVLQAACGGSAREATLHLHDREWANSLYGGTSEGNGKAQAITTTVLTLASIFDRFGVAVCDFLKIDCEGAEYEILLNADSNTLARIQSIALEYHLDLGGGRLQELEGFLRSSGFTVKSSPTAVTRGYLYAYHDRFEPEPLET